MQKENTGVACAAANARQRGRRHQGVSPFYYCTGPLPWAWKKAVFSTMLNLQIPPKMDQSQNSRIASQVSLTGGAFFGFKGFQRYILLSNIHALYPSMHRCIRFYPLIVTCLKHSTTSSCLFSNKFWLSIHSGPCDRSGRRGLNHLNWRHAVTQVYCLCLPNHWFNAPLGLWRKTWLWSTLPFTLMYFKSLISSSDWSKKSSTSAAGTLQTQETNKLESAIVSLRMYATQVHYEIHTACVCESPPGVKLFEYV